MSTIASLVVSLDMDSARLNTGARRAGQSLQSLAQTAQVAAGAMIAAWVAGKVTEGFKNVRDNVMEATDEISRMADTANRLGASFASLASLERSTQLAGANVESLTKGLDKLQRSIGNGSAGKALESIGLSIDTLRTKRIDESFLDVADAIRRIDDEGKQAAATYALFGRSGQELTVLLKQGSAELERQAAEAHRLGLTLSDETANGVEAMGDSWDDAKNAAKGFWRQLTGSLAPSLKALAELGTETITDGWAVTETFNAQALAADRLDASLKQLAKDRQAAANAKPSVDTRDDVLLRQTVQMQNAAARDWRGLEQELSDDYSELRYRLMDEIELYGKSARAVEIYQLKKRGLSGSALERVTSLKAELDALEANAEATKRAAEQKRQAQEELASDAKAIFEATRTPAEQYAAEMKRLDELVLQGAINWETWRRAAGQALATLKDADKADLSNLDLAGSTPAALEKGSAGALSAVSQARNGLKRIEDLEQLGLVESQQQTRLLGDIAAGAKNTVVANF